MRASSFEVSRRVARILATLLVCIFLSRDAAAMRHFQDVARAGLALADQTDIQSVDNSYHSIDVKAYGAVGDGATDDTVAINTALAAASSGAKSVIAPAGTYKITATLVVSAGVSFAGVGDGTKLNAAGISGELIRLDGDHASLSHMWLHGPGQVPNTADGRRGIWIGRKHPSYAGDYHDDATHPANYATVERVTIDHFTGNGISGVYSYAIIHHNVILNTTDAGIFLPPACTNNLVEGNTITGSRYSGIDINGSSNRVIGNYIARNGGGVLDPSSWNGILVTYISSSAIQPNAFHNIIEGNRIAENVGSGIFVFAGSTTAGVVNPPHGNIVKGNIVTGHTTQYDQSGATNPEWAGGICIIGGNNTIVEGNVSSSNTFNYVVSGISNNSSPGNQVVNNQSFNAATNARLTGLGKPSGVGYFFPGSARIDAVGGAPVTGLILKDNIDRYAVTDGYRVDLAGAVGLSWTGWTISGNHSDGAGGYGFNIVSASSFTNNFFDPSNYSINAGLANYNGFNSFGLTANSAAPSVANGRIWFTQNSNATTYTNFTDGVPGQQIVILVKDAHSTFKFSSGTLKGNSGAEWVAASGDFLACTYDGANWYCSVNKHQ